MRTIFIKTTLFLLFATASFCYCGNDSLQIKTRADERLNLLLLKYKESQTGKSKGYRIQLYFSAESSNAKEMKTKFQLKYPEAANYLIFEAPYFKLRAGNFRTKLESYKFLKEIITEFPGAFIVQDEIEFPD